MSPDTESTRGSPAPYGSPYLAGLGLGLTLLASYAILGTGLGASGGLARCSAWLEHLAWPAHVEGSAYFGGWFSGGEPAVLAYYLVAMIVGVVVGAFIAAWRSGRVSPAVERGPTLSRRARLGMALGGGVLVGFASRLARGCTSGQALSGAAMLYTGSLVFMVCLFIGGYATARLFRRQWQ